MPVAAVGNINAPAVYRVFNSDLALMLLLMPGRFNASFFGFNQAHAASNTPLPLQSAVLWMEIEYGDGDGNGRLQASRRSRWICTPFRAAVVRELSLIRKPRRNQP